MDFKELARLFTKQNLPDSEVELVGEIPYETLTPYREHALVHIAKHMELPGFRPGKVPADVALKKAGEIAVLEEATEMFVKDFYPELISEHKLEPVGRPDIRVVKLAPQNPVGLTVRVTLYPDIAVPKEWKTLHESFVLETAAPATEEEVQKTLDDLRQSRKKDEVVPELTDEFAKSLGAFENLEGLKIQIQKGITEEKARAARDARRGKLIEKLLEITPLAVPKVFIESEMEKILAQMREDVQRFGMPFDEYLKKVNKTEEGIRAEFRDQATRRAKLQMVLNKIAEEEEVEADPTAVEAEIKHALEHFPDAKPELVRIHIETVLRNEVVLKLLEGAVKTD